MVSGEMRDRWIVDTPNLAVALQSDEHGDLVLTSLRAGEKEWLVGETPMFAMDGLAGPSIAWHGVAGKHAANGELRLQGRLTPGGMTAVVTFTPFPDYSVIVVRVQIRNDTDDVIEVGSLTSLHLRTSAVADRQLHVLTGGRWDEAIPPRGYRLETYDMDELRRLPHVASAEDGRSTGEYLPWMSLTTPESGLYATLVWSGRWRMSVARQKGETSLALGVTDFVHRLAPGEELDLPGYVLSGFVGDLDGGADTWRAWMREHWSPAVPENWPWVQYNHWYAYAGDIDEPRLMAEARYAAEAGAEVFVIDDGWFLGRRPDSYHEGWGNWREDPAKFPNGLRAFGDEIRGLGMKFGLWVEPERADSASPVLREHPDFAVTRDGKRVTWLPHGEGSVHLCLGDPDVQDWMIADITRVVTDYGVDWLKWDYNLGYGRGCNNPGHGHQIGDGHWAHTMGLYRVLRELRAACPDLVIENCASGGHRFDLGTLGQTHTSWLSDYTARALSCRQHGQGAGLAAPLEYLNTWVLERRDSFEFRSRMGGAFGFSSFMGEWSASERAELRDAVKEYRRLRPLLNGERHLLTGPLHQDWEIWQFVDDRHERFAVMAFHESGSIGRVAVTLRGLEPGRIYRIERSGDATLRDISSDALLTDGIEFALPERGSEIIWGAVVAE